MDKINKIYSSIDITKFFFAICIVVLHTEVYRLLSDNLSFFFEKCILRLAVPFFFCISGFLLGEKLHSSESKNYIIFIRNYIMRLLRPLIVFESINVVLESIKMHLQGYSVNKIIIDNIKHICFYPYGALWYLQASVVGVVIAYPFISKRKINLALLLGSMGYAFALLSNNYYFLSYGCFKDVKKYIDSYMEFFVSARNGLFIGFFMIILGIKTYDFYVNMKIQKNILFFSFIFLYLLYILEVKQLKGLYYADDGGLYVMHILVVPMLILNLMNYKLNTEKTIILRNLSTGIYLLHRIVISILCIITFNQENLFLFPYPSIANFFVVLGSCVIICLGVYKIDCKILCGLLK